MWIVFSALSAVFSALTSILAKCGIRKTDSNVATAVRTVIVLMFSWFMVFISGSQATIIQISTKSVIFLILSGLSTGASWLCYFHALQVGDVNKVVPIDKSSTVLTLILAFVILGETITWYKGIAIGLIAVGTFLMIQKSKTSNETKSKQWLFYAVLSAVFAALTSILGKIGIEGVASDLGTAIRTCVVLVMSWIMVFVTKKQGTIKDISKKELCFICLSGLATGISWLCYYKALQDGFVSVVVSIDKLSIILTVTFSYIFFKEKLSKKALIGLIGIVVGTLLMVI